MTTLITGASGKTATPLAAFLKESGYPVLQTYNTRPLPGAIKFSWTDRSTWGNPFTHSVSPPVDKVYLVPIIYMADYEQTVLDFVDFAIERGVKRFVALLGSPTQYGGPYGGTIWKGLDEREKAGKIPGGWGVLRPTWFMDNFLPNNFIHHRSIVEENKIYSTMGEGAPYFISAQDIARVAFAALTSAHPPNRDYHTLGPEALTHNQIANIFSRVLGRTITHVHQPLEERIEAIKNFGFPDNYATLLSYGEAGTEANPEIGNNVVEEVTGAKPKRFEEFIKEHAAVWAVSDKD